MLQRSLSAARCAALAAVVVAVVGLAGYVAGAGPLGGVWLTAALGPTAYVLLIHPDDVESRLPAAALAHVIAVVAGLAALAVFGLWSAPSVAETHRETVPQVGAQVVAIALTVLLVTIAGLGHAPAAATTLLVASGIAQPGKPLIGLVLGLVVVLLLAPALTWLTTRFGTEKTRENARTPSVARPPEGGDTGRHGKMAPWRARAPGSRSSNAWCAYWRR